MTAGTRQLAAQRGEGSGPEILLFGFLAMLYWIAMPPDLVFEDAPSFVAACYTRGLAHPPGYPLHTLLCWPLTQLADLFPLSPAKAAALASALPMAAACAVLMRVLRQEIGSTPAAAAAAGLLGVAPAVWHHAIIAEVYGLNLLLAVATFAVAAAYVRGGSWRWLLGLAFLIGLGLANHWPLYLIALPATGLWLLQEPGRLRRDLASPRRLACCCLLVLAGLLPYLHLLWPAQGSYRFFTGQDQTSFIWYVSRQMYGLGGDNVLWDERLVNAAASFLRLLTQYNYLFGLLGLGGMLLLAKAGPRLRFAAVLWALLSCTSLLTLLRPYSSQSTLGEAYQQPYPLVAYAWFALPLALVLARLAARFLPQRWSQWAAVALIVGGSAAFRFAEVDRSSDDLAAHYAALLWAELPPHSTLVTTNSGRDFNFVIDYRKAVRNQRPDIVIVREDELFARLRDDLVLSPAQEDQLAVVGSSVAFMTDFKLAAHKRSYRGLYYLLGEAAAEPAAAFAVSARSRAFYRKLEAILGQGQVNTWTRYFAQLQASRYVEEAFRAQHAGQQLAAEDQVLYMTLAATPVGQYALLRARLQAGVASRRQIAIATAALLPHLSQLPQEAGSFVIHVMGVEQLLAGDDARARELFEQALARLPFSSNVKVIIDLLQLYAYQLDFEAYRRLRLRFPDLQADAALAQYDSECRRLLLQPCGPDNRP